MKNYLTSHGGRGTRDEKRRTFVLASCLIALLSSLPGAVQAVTINVTTYGATGNGSTNDTAAINNAIAALQPGDTLFFPCGPTRSRPD